MTTRRTRRTRLALCATVLGLLASSCSLPGRVSGPATIVAVFDDVGDLVTDHAVQQADIRVGSVTKIRLTDDFRAEVTMSVKDTGLRTDAIAELRTTSLLGEKFIEIRACDPAPPFNDTTCDPNAPLLGDEGRIEVTSSAPELEFVAETAVAVLGGVVIQDGVAPDLVTLVETGASSFKDRAPELRAIIDDFSSIASTLAGQVGNINTILDGLDVATQALADNDGEISDLLANLSAATGVLANSRDQAVATLRSLTSVLQAQDAIVFAPYLEKIDEQVKQLDEVVAVVTGGREQVSSLLGWLSKFVLAIPLGIPQDFAQIYGWVVLCPGPGC